jgi:hypothetical protein
MKKSFIAATAGVLAGAALLICAAPAMADPHIGFGITVGLPLPVVYAAPTPVAYAEPAPVVYGGYGYGPVVRIGSPYYYRDWHYYHGYHGDHDYRDHGDFHGHHDEHRGHR